MHSLSAKYFSVLNRTDVRKSAVAVLDQAVLSATNFSVGLILVRHGSDFEYGLYTLMFSALLFFTGMQNSLVLVPVQFITANIQNDKKINFISTVLTSQFTILIPSSFFLIVCGLLYLVFRQDYNFILALVVLGLILIPVFLREYLRYIWLLESKVIGLFWIDVGYSLLLIFFVFFSAETTSNPGILTIGTIGIVSAFSAIVSWIGLKSKIMLTKPTIKAVSELWKNGHWNFWGTVVNWLQNYGFLYLLSHIKNIEEVAGISATRLLLMPIAMVFTGIGSYFRPRGTKLYATGQQHTIWNILKIVTISMLAGSIFYIILVWINRDLIELILFKKQFRHFDFFIGLWAIIFLTQILITNIETLLLISGDFRQLFILGLINASISLIFGYIGIQLLEAPGSLIGLIIAKIFYLIWFFKRYKTLQHGFET